MHRHVTLVVKLGKIIIVKVHKWLQKGICKSNTYVCHSSPTYVIIYAYSTKVLYASHMYTYYISTNVFSFHFLLSYLSLVLLILLSSLCFYLSFLILQLSIFCFHLYTFLRKLILWFQFNSKLNQNKCHVNQIYYHQSITYIRNLKPHIFTY